MKNIFHFLILVSIFETTGCFKGKDACRDYERGSHACISTMDIDNRADGHVISGCKKMVDDDTGRICEYYVIRLECDRNIDEIVRSANNLDNIGKKIKCRLRLEHSDLSEVLDVTRNVPCTMTCKRHKQFVTSLDKDDKIQVCYPSRVIETWGVGDLRWIVFRKRFDVVLSLTIWSFDTQKEAEMALNIERYRADYCYGLSVEGNVIYNILVQSDYYVSANISIVTYKSISEGVKR